MGFTNVSLHGLYAEDIKINSMPITPCTWLHGDRYSKDFAKFTGVTAIQTYTTSLNEASLSKLQDMVTAGNQPDKERVVPASFMITSSIQPDQRAQQRADDEGDARRGAPPSVR